MGRFAPWWVSPVRRTERYHARVRKIAFALIAFVVGIVARPASAAMMTHTDLTSLAFEAEAIVRAKKVGERPIDQYSKMIDHVVVESYFGPFKAGDKLETEYGAYSFSARMFPFPADAGD